jgi:hypothetical protein
MFKRIILAKIEQFGLLSNYFRKTLSLDFGSPRLTRKILFGSPDELIPAAHQVRFLDAFVDKLLVCFF